jgi:hypothetical protein
MQVGSPHIGRRYAQIPPGQKKQRRNEAIHQDVMQLRVLSYNQGLCHATIFIITVMKSFAASKGIEG